MPFHVARRATLIAIALCSLPTLSAAPEWASDAVEEAWTFTAHKERIDAEADLASELESKLDAAKFRIRQKEMVYQAVEAGRLSLLDAAKQFRGMDRDWPGLGNVIYETERSKSDEEVAALCVLRGVRARVENGPPSLAEVIARLDASFEVRFGHKPPGAGTRYGR